MYMGILRALVSGLDWFTSQIVFVLVITNDTERKPDKLSAYY